jgi:hypothetical protein
MKYVFSEFGICKECVSDNGPQFASEEFRSFARKYEFSHITSSPKYPKSNGLAESGVKVVKSLLKKSKFDGSDFYLNLLVYRSTPLEFGKSPAELMFGRKIKSNLPVVGNLLLQKNHSGFVKQRKDKKDKQKLYHDRNVKELPPLRENESVRIRNSLDTKWSEKGIVVEQVAPRSYVVETPNGVYRRNRKDIMKTVESFDIKPTNDMDISEDQNIQITGNDGSALQDNRTMDVPPRRSERVRFKPKRLIEEI